MSRTPPPRDIPLTTVDAPSTPDLPALDHVSPPDIPAIAVEAGSTDDLAPSPATPAPVFHGYAHDRSPSSGTTFLALPDSRNARSPSPELLASETACSDSDLPPPSPTLSAHSIASSSPSVHFANHTSMALRGNKPAETDGKSSFGLLSPPSTHKRRGSAATASSSFTAETIADDRSDIGLVPLSPSPSPHSDAGSTLASPTHTHIDDSLSSQHSYKRHKHRRPSASQSPPGTPASESAKRSAPEVERPQPPQDMADIDPTPFTVKPYDLMHLVDPKNIEALEDLGGTEGVLHALGTHMTRGLSFPDAAPATGAALPPTATDAHTDVRVKSPAEPSITLTKPGGQDGSVQSLPSASSPSVLPDAYKATREDRTRVYGANVLPVRPAKSIWQLMWAALTDKVLILLSVAAVVSLALGFFQDFGPARNPNEPPVDWVEGVAIIVAIAVVVLVGSLNDYQKERQFQALNAKKEERMVKVIRENIEREISVYDVVVGDVAILEPGEIIPCDGIFLEGHNVRCDESAATGESDAIKKVTLKECQRIRDEKLRAHRSKGDKAQAQPSTLDLIGHTDCFVISGSKVLEGVGRYVVIAVGPNSYNGRVMMALRVESEDTPLQLKLNSLADAIAWAGMIAGIVLFVGLMIRFFVQLGQNSPQRTPSQKGIAFVNILIIAVTLVVVAVPEGLPLAVTLALAFATKRMTKENLLVRVLGSCETMANASVVCTDKTGTLTQNEMTVVAGSVGIHAKFVRDLARNRARAAPTADEANDGSKSDVQPSRKHTEDFALDFLNLNDRLPLALRDLINQAIAINSTAFEDQDKGVFIGSKTETALLGMAKELQWRNYKETRDAAEVLQVIPFSSERKAMGIVVRNPNGGARFFVKGASELLAEKCTRHVIVPGEGVQSADGEVQAEAMSELDNDNISRTITFYASQTLRTIALCYRDLEQWPPAECEMTDGEVPYHTLASDLTLIGVMGIEDPLRPGVGEAVADCTRAGVQVKMCTGDNVLTARSIATQCGIYTRGGIVMEGPHFRRLPEEKRKRIVPRLQVLARSSPEDKKILVDTLKELGEVVGVTGDGTNDGPALKTADVGFSMGITGTEVAKEASDIILMDDNFASIVKAIMWGRAVNDAVRKFLQFQLSTNITAVIITIVSGLASSDEDTVLTAVQLLWINIIMDTFAALALATDPATHSSLDRKPDRKWAPLFTVDMLKQIVGQSLYQTFIILLLHFEGANIFNFGSNADKHVTTIVFNAFVFAQIFNSFNCRRIDQKLNIFEGMTRNWYFMAITLIEIGAQVLIVFVGGAAFSVTPINWVGWLSSLGFGLVSIPLGAAIRLIPNGPCQAFFTKIRIYRELPVLPTMSPNSPEPFGFAYDLLTARMSTFRRVRGGRLRSSNFVVKSMTRKRRDEAGVVPGLLTMLPTLVGAHIITPNWTLPSSTRLADPAGVDPSRSSAALWENKCEVHPDTPDDDEVWKILGLRRT